MTIKERQDSFVRAGYSQPDRNGRQVKAMAGGEYRVTVVSEERYTFATYDKHFKEWSSYPKFMSFK